MMFPVHLLELGLVAGLVRRIVLGLVLGRVARLVRLMLCRVGLVIVCLFGFVSSVAAVVVGLVFRVVCGVSPGLALCINRCSARTKCSSTL